MKLSDNVNHLPEKLAAIVLKIRDVETEKAMNMKMFNQELKKLEADAFRLAEEIGTGQLNLLKPEEEPEGAEA